MAVAPTQDFQTLVDNFTEQLAHTHPDEIEELNEGAADVAALLGEFGIDVRDPSFAKAFLVVPYVIQAFRQGFEADCGHEDCQEVAWLYADNHAMNSLSRAVTLMHG